MANLVLLDAHLELVRVELQNVDRVKVKDVGLEIGRQIVRQFLI